MHPNRLIVACCMLRIDHLGDHLGYEYLDGRRTAVKWK